MVDVAAWPADEEVSLTESAFAVLEGELGSIETPVVPIREQFSFQVGMVFFISERYDLPPIATCNAADISDSSDNVYDISPPCSSEMSPVQTEPANAPPLEATSSVTSMLTLTFLILTLDMATHMRPLYITAEVEGIMINKVMVDTRAAVNVVTTRTIGLLGIPRLIIQTTSLTVKNFAGQVSRTLGLLFLRVKVLHDPGPRLDPQKFLYTFVHAPGAHNLG